MLKILISGFMVGVRITQETFEQFLKKAMVKTCDHSTKIKDHPIPEDWVVCHFRIKQELRT
jgi:hypothetical protein